MEVMTRHRSHSPAFKRQVAEEFIAGETLHALSKQHDISRQLVRIWVGKFEAGALDDDVQAADLIQEYEAKIAALERMVAGLILPWCNIEAMNLHLAAISAEIIPGRHAALLIGQAGWHVSARLVVPDNLTIVPLPAKCPELNPRETIWHVMRDNWLSNRVFTSYDNLLDHCCAAWNKLADQPWTMISIGMRDWAHGF